MDENLKREKNVDLEEIEVLSKDSILQDLMILEEDKDYQETNLLYNIDPETEEAESNKFNDCLNISSVFTKNYGTQKAVKIRPNYFLGVKINNEEIIKMVNECQNEIVETEPLFKKAIIKSEKLHITLFAMHIKDKNQLIFLNEKLTAHREEIFSNFKSHLPIKFQGLSTFRDQVVYVDLVKDEYYKQLVSLQKSLVKVFENWGVSLCEKSFTPHMTLMKLTTNSHHFRKKGIKKISKDIYKHMIDNHFGVESIDMIHLCNMQEKQHDGFYKIENSIEFIQKKRD